jgi:hypothetical protein
MALPLASRASLDVHSYDGHLPPLQQEPSLSLAQALEEVRSLTAEPKVHTALQLLGDPSTNHDPLNNLNASTLFCLAWEKVKPSGQYSYFFEQLADIVEFGPCLQGRTTRLYQFVT